MTKRKKESQKENRVATKVSGGKITKAKHKETPMETRSTKKMHVRLVRTPLVQRQSTSMPQELISATHSPGKLVPQWTSTPLNTATAKNPEDKTFRRLMRTSLKYNTLAAPDRPPLSPIGNLINTSSNVGRDNSSIQVGDNKSKENESPLPTKTRMNLRMSTRAQESATRTRSESKNCPKSNTGSTVLKVSECNNPGRISRRRSVGIPKVSKITRTNDLLQVPTKYQNNRCSDLRVRLTSCSSSAYKSPDAVIPKTNNQLKSAPREPNDLSFIQRLRDDWSTTRLNDTLSQVEQIKDRTIIPLRADKRKLSPVIELSSYESSLSTLKPLRTTSANEDEYSSSAEFESSDEKENSCSRRAPTWKDLSNKSVRSASASHTRNQISHTHLQNSRSMKVRVRKLRIQAAPGGSVTTNKDTEVISENKNDKVPSKNVEETIVTSKEVPSQEENNQQADMNNSSQEPAATDYAMSPSPKSRNLLNKSDVIEEILSSSADNDAQHISTTDKTNLNCTRKFFHSRRDHTVAVVPQTVEQLNTRRTSGRNKKRDKIYEFLSQSSSDSNDPVADVIQKMINNGKVVVAKHKKGTGKSVVPRRKRKVATKNKHPEADVVFVKPNPPSPVKAQPPSASVEVEPIDNDLAFDEGSAPYVDEEPVRDQRGFSKLARSAMMKHAGKSDNSAQRKMITDKQQLLAMAQKFVGQSTPVRVSSPMSNVTTPFSPISGGSSPWRVDDDKLPTTFYFDRNSDNLPSYSSDYIPSTPLKNKSKSTSSFSSNDSNGENVAPPSVPLAENHTQISLNPRRALSYRSPLKAINILDVVNLPPLALHRRDNNAPKENTNSNKLNNSAGNKSNANVSNLFGFEEMIEDDEGDIDTTHQVLNAEKIDLKEQMQKLQRLRYDLPKATTSTNNCIKPVFDEERQRQKTLQQMFCSTMIERQSIEPQKRTAETNNVNGTGDGNLFQDPETTFDQSTARRSYSRPFKRKRKLRHNFVMFMDSDASEEEDDDVAAKKQQKKLKERNKKAPKENLELKKFVNDFNAMYKEVSEYELIVE